LCITPTYRNACESELSAYSLANFTWALSIIWSRTFKLPGDITGLLPFADLFNAEPVSKETSDIQVIPSNNASHFVLKAAKRVIKAGEQILVPYGTNKRFSNGQLLLDYGFTFENNPNDMVIIQFSIPQDDPYYNLKSKLLLDAGIISEEYPVAVNTYPLALLIAMRIYYMTSDEFRFADRVVVGRQLTTRNEMTALRNLALFAKKLLSTYATTIEQDEELLETATQNILSIIRVRLSEKRILVDLIHQTQHQLHQLVSAQ